jgi:hypothetical protein
MLGASVSGFSIGDIERSEQIAFSLLVGRLFWQILLQKSDAKDRVVWPFVRGGGFKPPALTLFTQLQLYAMHRTSAGGGRATNDASRRRF